MRLLILTCSARKRGGDEPIPAIDRYDGPLWQMVRNYLRTQPLRAIDLEIYALSAEFGLIAATHPIPHYERTMDAARADELRPTVLVKFARLFQNKYSAVCLGMSQRYLRAIEGWNEIIPIGVAVTLTDGAMGQKLGQLRTWLDGQQWQTTMTERPVHIAAPVQLRGSVKLSGTEITMNRDEVLERARIALQTDAQAATRFRDWYVIVDGQRVAAKWVASIISGLPTSCFDAANARRALLALGIDIERMTT